MLLLPSTYIHYGTLLYGSLYLLIKERIERAKTQEKENQTASALLLKEAEGKKCNQQ
jgi:hypothetical protein